MMFNPASWLLALVFGDVQLRVHGLCDVGAHLLQSRVGAGLETASFYASLGSLA